MSDISPKPQPAAERSRPTKKLPTFRVGYEKQTDALRAYAVLSENATKSVHYGEVAKIIKVHEANVSSANPFFLEVGFIEKRDSAYAPTAAVLEYNRQFGWKPETAAQKLAPIIAKSWFGQALTNWLQFRPLSEDEAIEALAAECAAGPEAKPQLRMLLDYAQGAGLIERANGQLTLAPQARAQEYPWGEEAKKHEAPAPKWPEPSVEPPPAQPSPPPMFSKPGDESSIRLTIGIDVNLSEMRDWPPDRITAFFAGIAQVLAAKNQQ